MILRIKGESEPKKILEILGAEINEICSDNLRISGLTMYINLSMEGKSVDLVDPNTGKSADYSIILNDTYEEDVLKQLKENIKNKDIAENLKISHSRVSKIKKKLISEGKLIKKETD